MKIIDAHHHFWDPKLNYHPWLCDERMIEFRYGDYSSLKTRFMLNEYDKASKNWDIAASITMEGEWDPTNPLGEAIWIEQLHKETGRPAAHVAQIWLDHKDLPHLIERYQSMPIIRSVRHKPSSQPAPNMGHSGIAETQFQRGFEQLSKTELAFDLQVPWWHLDEIFLLKHNDIPIILNHAGLPSNRSTDGINAWKDAITRFAELPNSFVKISGLGLKEQPWRLEDNREIILTLIDIFGPKRSMFASNFPVDGLCGSFDTIFNGFDETTRKFSDHERHDLFYGTAVTAYKIKLPSY